MLRCTLPLGLWIALFCSVSFSQPWTAALFRDTHHDFGAIARGAKAEHAFLFENPTDDEIHIAMIRSNCGCATVRIQDGKRSIAPGQTTAIIASLNSASFVGARSATITIALDKPGPAELQLHLKAYVRSDVRIQPGRVEFGAIAGGRAAERSIQVSSSGRYSWGIVQIKCQHPHLRCEAVETARDWNQVSYEVRVKLDGKAGPGYLRDRLILVTNEPQQREIPVPVEARILPDITVSPAMLFLGVVAPGQEVNRQLVVHAKKPFRITAVKADGENLEIDLATGKTPKPLYLVPVTFRAGLQPGKVAHTIHIETDLEGRAITVPASALVAAPPLDVPVSLGGRLPILQRLLGGSRPASPAAGSAPLPSLPATPLTGQPAAQRFR